jgi:hypothetical protein
MSYVRGSSHIWRRNRRKRARALDFSDWKVLDQHLEQTISQFEHKAGVVQTIDTTSE